MLSSGATAPNIVATDLAGEPRSLTEDLASGPALVAFFKVSCPTCQYTFPYLQRLADSGVPVIGISQDEPGPTQSFCDRLDIRFPVWLDWASQGYPASNAYGITTVPSLFLIEPSGIVTGASFGFSKQDLIEFGSRFGAKPFTPEESVPEFKPG